MARAARFTILDEKDPKNEAADYIVLDIPADRLDSVYEKILLCKLLVDAKKRDGEPVDGVWCIDLVVKPEHQKLIGSKKADGSPPDVSYPPSLLTEEIPRE